MLPPVPVRAEHLVDEGAARLPHTVALIYGDHHWTYMQMRDEVNRRAALLVEAGFAPGDVAAIIEPPSDDLIFTVFACFRADLTLLYLAPTLTAAEYAPLLTRARIALLLTADGRTRPDYLDVPALPLALPGTPGRDAVDEAARRSATGGGEAIAALISTSGTTGTTPKLARVSHRALIWRRDLPVWWEQTPQIFFRPGVSYLHLRSFCEFVSRFGTVILSQTLDPAHMEEEMAAHGVTALMGTGATLHLFTDQRRPPPLGLALQVVRTGSMTIPRPVRDATAQRYGAAVLEEYASTEGGAMLTTPQGGTPYGSIGTPYPGVEARIVDDAGNDVTAGETGELIVRTPAVMHGYLDNPTATANALRDGWLWTGDMARQDAAGNYYLEGRRSLRINVSGVKVVPEEVEAVLLQHPGIREVAVLGMPDATRGEVVRAVIVPHGEPPTASELRRFCRAQLAAVKVPRRFEFRTELPRSPAGKILRRLL